MTFLKLETYKKLLYLLLTFPLGLFYFLFLLTGYSLGVGLSVVLVGVPIFLFTLFMTIFGVEIERVLANRLLDMDLPRRLPVKYDFQHILTRIIDPRILLDTLYLLLKLPLGGITFGLTIIPLFVVLGLIISPFLYLYLGPHNTLFILPINGLVEALVTCFSGLFLAILGRPIIDMFINFWTKYTFIMLDLEAVGAQSRAKIEKQPAKRKRDDGLFEAEEPVHLAIPTGISARERQSIQRLAHMMNEKK